MTAIYTRQSIDKKDSVSIETQTDLCRQATGNDDFRVYTDKGFSGKNLKRPAYLKMIDDIQHGLIDHVVVYRLDRLSRSVSDFSRMWEVFDKYGVIFTSVSEKFDTGTPIGKAMIYIIMTFAQLERETIAQRITDNYYERLTCGSWPGGPAPFGFRSDSVEICGHKKPTLVPNENISSVKYIFEQYADTDKTLSRIGCELTAMGITMGKRKGWDNVALSRILHSPVYVMATQKIYDYYLSKNICRIVNPVSEFTGHSSAFLIGKRKNGKTTSDCQQTLALSNFNGIIPDEIWLKCQRKLSENTASAASPSLKYSYLTGLLKCCRCGYSIVIKKSGKYTYMCCSGRYNLHICSVTSLPYDCSAIDRALWARIDKIIREISDLTCRSEISLTLTNKLKTADIESEINALISLMPSASETVLHYLNRKIDELDAQRAALSAELSRDNIFSGYEADIVSLFELFDYETLSNEEKNIVARALIDRIIIDDKKAEIIWHPCRK